MESYYENGDLHFKEYYEKGELIRGISFEQDGNQVKISVKRGLKRTRPKEVAADKAYDAAYVRKGLSRRGIKAMIPERQLRPGARRRKKGPHHRFDKATYKKRASIEQSIGWIKECRRIATRYEKLAVSFIAMVKLAFIKFYLKRYSSDTA